MSHNILSHTMLELTWCEVEEAAKKNAVVLLPVGVVEEHSRHLPLGTDIYVAAAQAQDIAAEMEANGFPCIIAPPFYWGICSNLTKLFPGTFTSKKETVGEEITNILESLERAGFKRAVLLNAHGDWNHIAAITEALNRYNPLHALQAKWLTFEDDVESEGLTGVEEFLLAVPPYPLEKMIQIDGEIKDQFDVHAGAFETTVVREKFPELVKEEAIDELKATMFGEEEIRKWQSAEKENKFILPDGHAGDPAASHFMKSDMATAGKVIAQGIMAYYQK